MLTSRDSSHCRAALLLLLFIFVAADCGMAQVAIHAAAARIEKRVSTSEEPAWLSIDYTGALFGYYRIEPDDQNQAFGDLGPVQKFLAHRKNKTGVLLGMGDNFGPEFGASVQREFVGDRECYLKAKQPWPGHANVPPEILYKMEDRLPQMAECDNVARFFMRAGYSAIVPGKEDFLYSALWLRRMAVLFHGASEHRQQPDVFFPETGGTQAFATNRMPISESGDWPLLLAANVRLNFKVETNAAASIVDNQKLGKQMKGAFGRPICPLLFSWDPLPEVSHGPDRKPSSNIGAGPHTCVSGSGDGNTVTTEMDWLRRLDATQFVDPTSADKYPVAAAMNAQASANSIFRRQLLENESQIIFATLTRKDIPEICPGTPIDIQDMQKLGEALQALGKDSAFEKLKDESSSLSLTIEGQKAANTIQPILAPCQNASTELNELLTHLSTDFSSTSSTSPTKEFLFSTEGRRAAIRLLLRKIAAEQRYIGYKIIGASKSTPGTLVIGVIGPETMTAVSPTNLRLCTIHMTLDQEARTRDFQACDDPANPLRPDGKSDLFPGRLVGKVVVGDPVLAVTTLLRAARENAREGKTEDQFDKVVVMAQMPRTEAEELGAHVLSILKRTGVDGEPENAGSADFERIPHVDVILSEAQKSNISPGLTLRYTGDSLIPVLTPKPSGEVNEDGTSLVEPISNVTIEGGQHVAAIERLFINEVKIERPLSASPQTMAEKLYTELQTRFFPKPSRDLDNLQAFWKACNQAKACENSVMMRFLLEQTHRSSRADVVLLEYRDFYFGPLLQEYDQERQKYGTELNDYGPHNICHSWAIQHPGKLPGISNPEAYCKLRVALDRVLWKGDYSERVMVDGKTLKSALSLAQQETNDEQSLAARDTTDEWLMTYGIVTEPPKNLSASSMGPGTFAVPGARFCKNDGSDEGKPQYCVDGRKITDDGAYWVSTSDHLAQDSQLYKVFNSLDAKYHEKKKTLFLTGEIADEIAERNSKGTSEDFAGKKKAANAPVGMSKIEVVQQDRPVTQLDYAKAVVGFMFRKPDKSNTALGTDFSGVADSRATTPSAQEVDLEAVTRVTRGLGIGTFWHDVKIGIQSDLEYDRAVTGNIAGNPETVTWASNSFTTGGFVQYRFLSHRFLPQSSRFFLVVAPYQYQQQVTGNYLNFKFTTPPGQITVATPAARGFVQRLGGRWEFGGSWAGSYAESGPQYSETHNVLSDLILPDGTDCMVSASSFATCFKQEKLVITSTTILKPLTKTLHTGGWYWDVHLQKPLNKSKRTSFTVETKGDHSELPGFTLPTQSHYAFTTTGALNFAVIGNFVFSPTYTTFFYRNQGTQGNPSNSLVTNTFSVTAKWYFDRDAAVPFWKQLWFQGPASLDQTKTAKMK